MIAAGCDVGSLTAKAVLMNNGDIIAAEVVRAKGGPEESARMVMDAALAKAGLSMEDIGLCVGTGYGRKQIPFVDAVESEIVCHGKGAVWQAPDVRTIVDIGGQDCKAIRIDDTGNVARYVYNDRCASGTGRFLEIIAEALEIGLEEMGDIDARAENHLTLSRKGQVVLGSSVNIPHLFKAYLECLGNDLEEAPCAGSAAVIVHVACHIPRIVDANRLAVLPADIDNRPDIRSLPDGSLAVAYDLRLNRVDEWYLFASVACTHAQSDILHRKARFRECRIHHHPRRFFRPALRTHHLSGDDIAIVHQYRFRRE